ncbi:hypothetical protein [Psychrobacillus sp. BM2]|uniref:hypothetical protein n=1 Tax=Psychrobacillus sp. BM2 TaxID=3400421 RepID=UPI003B01D2AC
MSETIIAGVIAFIGAIIGGAITLAGVKMTIDQSNEKEMESKLHLRKHAVDKTMNQLIDAREKLLHRKDAGEPFEGALGGFLISLKKVEGIIDSAAESSRKVYQSVLNIELFLDQIRYNQEFYQRPEKEKFSIFDKEVLNCFLFLREQKLEMINELQQRHPN